MDQSLDGEELQEFNHAISLAGDLLASRFGGRPELTDPENLGGSGRSLVLRMRVSPNPFLPNRSIVVKQLPKSSAEGADPALLREIVAYQFATSLPESVRPGPELLAYDVDKRILVISDAGDADTLMDVLGRADDEQRMKLYRSLGGALGRMHVGTAHREDGFNALLRRLWSKHRGKEDVVGARDRGIVESIEFGLDVLRSAGIDVPPGVESFALDASRRLASGHHRAFTPFDLDPSNILMANRVVFLDYEWAGYRDAVFDVASVVAGFPLHSFSTRPTRAETEVFIRAWAEEVRSIWHKSADDRVLHTRVIAALIGWTLISVSVVHFGSAEQGLGVKRGEIDLSTSELGGGDHQRADLENTTSALLDVASMCEDNRAKEVRQFAEDLLAHLSA
ncbi:MULTISPECIES: hypothetical protein [unclassified Corynebacterium]|uniref:hypothetical protein n=1 Tax=unclassified Corynebacterium TaxID=2624378 RepID=UPI0030B74EBF